MVWEQKTPCVVMLTQFEETITSASGRTFVKEKSSRYLPQDPSEPPHEYGGLRVECVDRATLAPGLERRRLALRRVPEPPAPADDARFVEHIHFTAWPDFGRVGDEHMRSLFLALDAMCAALRASPGPLYGPAVLHCSAGIGRSGAFAALALIKGQLDSDGARDIDVLETVARLRNERPGMVQSVAQYEMIYDALAFTLGLLEEQQQGR